MRHFSHLLALAGLVTLTPAVWGAQFSGDFTTTTFTESDTFNNFGGSTVNLTATCGDAGGGVGGNTCNLSNALSTGFSLGVNTAGDGLGNTGNPLQGSSIAPSDEFVVLNFASTVDLIGAQLDMLATGTNHNAYDVYVCTTATCTSKTSIGSGVSGVNASDNISFTGTAGRYFEIATNSSTTEFGINSVTFDSPAVPEPATIGLVGFALLGLGGLRLRRRNGSS